MNRAARDLLEITAQLRAALADWVPSQPVSFTYRPLDYAEDLHRQWITRYCDAACSTLLVGMNPGPWGMAQTAVPFGAVSVVRDWFALRDNGMTAPAAHPKKPIQGLACPREEVSGARLWGWVRTHWPEPSDFFRNFWITNYCPLLFLDEAGRNLTPDKLSAADRDRLLPACDRALRDAARALSVDRIVGVGVWAEQRARQACAGLGVEFGRILHPSPASPAANRGWSDVAEQQLRDLGIHLPNPRPQETR